MRQRTSITYWVTSPVGDALHAAFFFALKSITLEWVDDEVFETLPYYPQSSAGCCNR